MLTFLFYYGLRQIFIFFCNIKGTLVLGPVRSGYETATLEDTIQCTISLIHEGTTKIVSIV